MAEEFDHDAKSVNKNHVNEMYQNWFLDYASYVILERAVPAGLDGLKPVQRRILHALKEMDDGRFNKVANVIGQTMQYHPHGDASIADAIVNIGQKDLMLDTQGNWGDFRTGDNAAAPRYIETRLSKSRTNSATVCIYSCSPYTIHSERPSAVSIEADMRRPTQSPANVTSGTPIHKASHDVVPPPTLPTGSRAMSNKSYCAICSLQCVKCASPRSTTRSGLMPKLDKTLRIRS